MSVICICDISCVIFESMIMFICLTRAGKFRKIEIISSTFHIMKVCNEKLITKEKTGKANHICRLNSILLNNLWINKEIKGEFKNYLKMSTTWQNEKSAFVLHFNLQPVKYS